MESYLYYPTLSILWVCGSDLSHCLTWDRWDCPMEFHSGFHLENCLRGVMMVKVKDVTKFHKHHLGVVVCLNVCVCVCVCAGFHTGF